MSSAPARLPHAFAHQRSKAPLTPEEGKLGEQVPFGDPYWYQGFVSPYYTASHVAWREKCRKFVDEHVLPVVDELDEAGVQPPGMVKKLAEHGFLGSVFNKAHGGTPPADFDAFHDLIQIDEFGRCGSQGVSAAGGILTMALPPVLMGMQNSALREKVAKECLAGDKQIALAISEPFAGSDVASLRTTARKTGDVYILNGQKKWITNAFYSDYYTVACRTGAGGMGGISLLLVERNMPGVKVERMKLSGHWSSGTATIQFEDVRVPVDHLIGEENQGFMMIMHNFNHERFVIAAGANRTARLCMEEAIKWGRKRETFGKKLVQHQVIKHKIADMARQIEATHALLEQVAYQMKCGVSAYDLGRSTALLKVQATRTLKHCALESAQVLGGAAYVRGGPGVKIERTIRELVAFAIPGGSEEILMDLGMRMAKL